MKVATAGQWVKATRSAIAGRRRSQPWTVAVARALIASRIADPGKKRDYADEIPYAPQKQSGKMPTSGDQSGKMPRCFPSARLSRTREDDDDVAPRRPRGAASPSPAGVSQRGEGWTRAQREPGWGVSHPGYAFPAASAS